MSTLQRFERKVERIPFCECHIWTAAASKKGYGKFVFEGRTWELAHRVAYKLYSGPIPDGLSVLHRCDNPYCVNPRHLYLGTYKDNAIDREVRNRGNHVYGMGHGRNKLTNSQVLEIRDLHDTGKYSCFRLASIYGVNRKTVNDIVNRKIWKTLH
jgi:hypothetical protein